MRRVRKVRRVRGIRLKAYPEINVGEGEVGGSSFPYLSLQRSDE